MPSTSPLLNNAANLTGCAGTKEAAGQTPAMLSMHAEVTGAVLVRWG